MTSDRAVPRRKQERHHGWRQLGRASLHKGALGVHLGPAHSKLGVLVLHGKSKRETRVARRQRYPPSRSKAEAVPLVYRRSRASRNTSPPTGIDLRLPLPGRGQLSLQLPVAHIWSGPSERQLELAPRQHGGQSG